MCNFVECEHNRASSSVGAAAESAVAMFGILGVAAAAGAVFRAALVPIGVALALGWLLYWKPTRRATLTACSTFTAGVLLLVRFAWRRLRRRKPGKTVVLPGRYTATMVVTGPDGQVIAVLGTAPVPGTWTSQADVEREVLKGWIATHGKPDVGTIGCHARQVSA